MVSTRSADAKANGSPETDQSPAVGEKHDLGSSKDVSPSVKKAKTIDEEKPHQIKIEDSMPKVEETNNDQLVKDEGTKDQEQVKKENDEQASEAPKADQDEKDTSTAEQAHKDPDVPSSVLEKGIIYFFFRPRVRVDEPEGVEDIARSYLLLRPMAPDARLGEGTIGDAGNSRLLVVPKKTLPRSGKERFMVFVDMAGVSFAQLKDDFLKGVDRETKTRGTTHVPAATPAAEGVYVITSTGRDSHLAYHITLPEKLGEVQEELGLRDAGSFIISTKNPEYPGPSYAQLPQGPEFPKEILEEFRGLRWFPTQPKHLDYVNAQLLLIGERSIGHALEQKSKDEKQDKETPQEVFEELEEEDVKRMKGLEGDASSKVFTDLEARAAEYPKMQTTF